MSEFASQRNCLKVVSAISELVPHEEFAKSITRVRGLNADISTAARIGSARQNRYGAVEFNPRIPTAWLARVCDTPYSVFSVSEGKTSEKYDRAFTHSNAPLIAEFEVYGLDIYGAASYWNQISWEVVKPNHLQDGELAIFLGATLGSRVAAVDAGHADYDEQEEVRILTNIGDSRDVNGDSMAKVNSLRLTETGADFLLDIVHDTKAYELTEDAGMIQPRQTALDI